jgi:hypothetical protein
LGRQFEEILKNCVNQLSSLSINTGRFRELVDSSVFIELRAVSEIVHPTWGQA